MEAGFTNISFDILYDIVWNITPVGEVKQVSIAGNTTFQNGDVYKKDAAIVITYHDKAENNPATTSSVPTNPITEPMTKAKPEDNTIAPSMTHSPRTMTDYEIKKLFAFALESVPMKSSEYNIKIENSIVNVYLKPEGISFLAYAASTARDKEAIKEWNTLVATAQEWSKAFNNSLQDNNRTDLQVALYYSHDMGNTDNVLLCVMNGLVLYDYVNGINYLGV